MKPNDIEFEIFFSELDEETQEAILEHFNLPEPPALWEKCPIATVYWADIGALL